MKRSSCALSFRLRFTNKGMSLERPGDVTANGGDSHETTRKVRPLNTPDAFNGEASVSFDEWIGHFESVAKVNGWDDATCLL